MRKHLTYCVRITSDDGDVGKSHLYNFMDIEESTPVVVVTSRMLSTGVDIPTCQNVVIFREIETMTEFKQIIGRGTRVREDKKKLFFTVLDYTGSATRKFADPAFDGQPPLITDEQIDGEGNTVEFTEVKTVQDPDNDNPPQDGRTDGTGDTGPGGREKYRVEEGQAKIATESIHVMDEQGRLRTVEYRREAVRNEIATMVSLC